MEADPPNPLPPSLQETLEEQPPEGLQEQPAPSDDPWSDQQSEKEEKEDREEEPPTFQLTIPVGEAAQKVKEFEYNEYCGYDHQVDYKYLVLIIVMNGHGMIDLKKISGLKEGYIEMNSRKNKLIVKTTSKEVAGEAIERISDFIDSLSVHRLEFRGEIASRFSNFSALKNYLRNDGVVMFGTSSKQIRELFIGGAMKPSELRLFQERVKSFRVVSTALRCLRNTRSYRLIVSAILGLKPTQDGLQDFNLVKLSQVQRRNRFRQLRVVLGTISAKEYTANDYEDAVMREIRKCCAVAFIFTSKQRFIEKPKLQGVTFKIINERSVGKSYLYVIAGKEEWCKKMEEIKKEVGKLEKVVGIRFFYHLFPHFYNFRYNRQRYYFFRYPQNRPYSVSVLAKGKEGFSFNWQVMIDRIVQACQGQDATAVIE